MSSEAGSGRHTYPTAIKGRRPLPLGGWNVGFPSPSLGRFRFTTLVIESFERLTRGPWALVYDPFFPHIPSPASKKETLLGLGDGESK